MTYFQFLKAFNTYLEVACGKPTDVRIAEAQERIVIALEKIAEKEDENK